MSEQRVTDVELRERINLTFDTVYEAIQERTITRVFGDRLLGEIAAIHSALAAVNRADEGDSRLREARDEQRPYAAYSKNRTHGIHINEDRDCREYVVGECFIDAALASLDRVDPAPGLRDRFRFQLATTEMRDKDQALSAFDAALAAARPMPPDEPEGGR